MSKKMRDGTEELRRFYTQGKLKKSSSKNDDVSFSKFHFWNIFIWEFSFLFDYKMTSKWAKFVNLANEQYFFVTFVSQVYICLL